MKTDKLLLVQDPEKPVPTEVMAQALLDLAEGAKKLLAGPLTERAILVLLNDATSIPMKIIREVLRGASDLAVYVKNEHR